MLGGTGGGGVATSPGADNLLTVTVARDEHGYGMKVSGDNPVYVQSVKEHGAAWRAGLRSGDRILRVDSVPVHHHTHQQVVQLIRANPSPVLTVQQNSSRHKTPITAPQPVNPEKQRQLEATKAHTFRMMLEQEQKYIRDLRNELLKVPDVRKQAELAAAEQRCCNLQTRIDSILAAQYWADIKHKAKSRAAARRRDASGTGGGPSREEDLSETDRKILGIIGDAAVYGDSQHRVPVFPEAKPATPKMPRAEKNAQNTSFLSGLPRSLSNLTGQSLRNLRQRKDQPLIRQNSEESKKRHNNTVPMVPTTCLDNTPPPLPPRSERFNSPPLPLKPSTSRVREMRRSSHSLDELEPQPNSIAMQLSYPLVNVPPPPLQTDNRSGLPILHVRSQSSPEQLDDLTRSVGERPPGTPPPPYPHQPCGDPQRAIISMEEDDSPASDNSTYSGLFSNLRSVRDSRARMAVLINWLLGERRSACAALLLVLTDGYRAAAGVPLITLRRWAYELQSTFLVPAAVLQLNGVDENMANEIDHVLVNEHDKEELLRNVFRKARRLAKDELARQLSDFQLKRRAGLGALYGPTDDVLKRCALDRQQEQIVVERLMTARLTALAAPPTQLADTHAALLAAVSAAALCLGCRPASVAAAVGGGTRATFLQRDKPYKQRVKQLAKQHPQPFIVRGHHLQAQALTAANHCHHCGAVIAGIAPQAFVCTDCNLRVHRACARAVEETCVLEHGDHGNRISRLMERMTPAPHPGLENDRKSRKSAGSGHFLNMERSFRKNEDIWDQPTASPVPERRDESDESLYESADGQSDAISASDDALPRLGKTPTISKESLKLAITDEEADYPKLKKGHRKTMSLSHPFEIVKSLGDDLFEHKNDKKSRESLWSEEDGKTDVKKKEDVPKRKTSKGSSVSALNFLRRKKTPTSMKAVEAVVEVVDGLVNTNEILSRTKFFLEEEKRYAEVCLPAPPPVETDSDEEIPAPKIEHRRRLSRQTSRSKSKVRGKSQSVRVNTLRKSHSGTLKKGKKKSVKSAGRSRQASFVEPSPVAKKKNPDAAKQNSWLFSNKGEPRREGSHEEPPAAEGEGEPDTKEPDKENEKSWRGATRGVNRAESCRERDAPRRGKHRNASDPNRLTAHPNHDLEPGAATAPSGSSSSSSLSSRSNESNTVPPDQASQSDWSEEEEPLAAQWSDSLPPAVRDALVLSARLRKRQEVIHELIVSEGSHVRWLKVLGVDFLKPLERQPTLLSAEELRALFPNLPSVRERHSRLYAELRSARESAPQHVVQIRPIADALLNTLGEAGYAACLSKFCQGQRMALDALKERRRKSKELQQFLAGREQLPRCGRLQLRDLLACVWQRLTKYQLLLEGIIKTVHEGTNDAEGDSDDAPEDAARLKAALAVAKEVLHSVDTAIRTAENEHRLRTIQSKLEIRVGTLERAEAEELRRTDLTQCRLRYEGELLLRADTKKTAVLALLLEDRLVLLQREGDKFVLRPVPTAAAGAQLLPVIKWDKVLFRPNAAVRNTFFLMNINGIQMHELSATTAAEYAIWVKHIQESPLARLAEVKSVAPPAPPPPEHHGTNVSRNPSDASEKSTTSTHSCEQEGATETEDRRDTEERERQKQDEEENEKGTEKGASSERDSEEKHTPTVGRISTHLESPATLESCTVTASVCTASRCVTPAERLRRLDAAVTRALRAKAAAAAEMLRVPVDQAEQLAEIAAEDTLRQLEAGGDRGPPDLHQLLLAAQAQANQLTEILNSALSVSEGAVVAARAGRCDRCCRRDARHRHSETRDVPESDSDETSGRLSGAPDDVADSTETDDATGNPDPNSDWARSSEEFSGAAGAGAAALAARLAGAAGGLQAVLGALLATLPALEAERTSLRQQLAVARERADRDYHMSETLPRGNMDQSIQEQPSHGG